MSTNADELLRARLGRVFDMKDFDKDGKITEEDFVEWGNRAARHACVDYTSELQDSWKKAHQAYFGDRITKGPWIDGQLHFCQTEGATEMAVATNSSLFKCVDVNGDGVCSFKEYYSFVQPLGVTENDAKESFKFIDTDGNGTLSVEEFSLACWNYYSDPDPRCENFYGIIAKQG